MNEKTTRCHTGQINKLSYLSLSKCIAVFGLSLCSLSGHAENIAENGGVENGLNHWSSRGGSLSQNWQVQYSGGASAKITGRTDTWHGATFSASKIQQGGQYEVSVWVRLTQGTSDTQLILTAKRTDDADTATYKEYVRLDQSTVSANGWTKLSGTYTQSGTPFQYFIIESSHPTASYYMDEFVINTIGNTDPGDSTPDDGGDAKAAFVGNITTNGSVRSDFVNYWDQLTPENEGKWGSVEKSRDVYSWNGLDAAYQYAKQQGIPFKQHTFVWGSQYPSWINNLSAAEQAAEIEEWIRDYCQRYPETRFIDVVNEATPGHAPAEFAKKAFGDDWIIDSFKLAKKYCPNATLIINDYNVLSWHTDKFIETVKPAVQAGVVDAIGVQAHGLESFTGAQLQAKLDQLASLGLPIYVSEYDIAKTDDSTQLSIMKDQFPVFYRHPSVAGITLWGYVVGATWRDGTGLIYSDGSPRPAMTWLMNYLGR